MVRRPLADLQFLVVHHSVTPETWTVEDLRQLHRGMGYEDIGYHFIITKSGLRMGRPVQFRGAHALVEKDPYKEICMNWSAVGVCLLGDFSCSPPDPVLINEAAYAIRRIVEKLKIPLDREHIIGHSAVSVTTCPGPFTMEALYRKLEL